MPLAQRQRRRCRRHEACASGVPGGSGGGWMTDEGAGSRSAGAAGGGSACSTWRSPCSTCGSNQRGVLSSTAPKKFFAASSGNGRVQFPALTASLCRCTRS